ncbi:hypothetical protein [Ktedonobacter sp. SOSP1-52]|uniref:hypothetical protein n=1 Tax=Ktedonobacter sp. SOSP1-52 TaxID=2778366 RepID=UPI0019164C57|nr:hypothetical protein [Ktedonobacter sp. SOSP1-52]
MYGGGDPATHWTVLFFHAMLSHPEPLGRQIDDLASFWDNCWLQAQIVVAPFTLLNWMNEYFIWRLDLPSVMSTMALLSIRFLPTRLPQALGRTPKTIR